MMKLHRRSLLAGAGAALAAPSLARAASQTTLKFVPNNNLGTLDPLWTTAAGTKRHAFLVFDTLYGQAADQSVSPQMVAGHTVDDDGRRWTLTLRDGLVWHDGEKVLARDCVASIRRWGVRDAMGQELMAATDELSAPDDRTILFRLKRPFPLLPAALGKSQAYVPVMMPQRLAETPPGKQVTEMTGSGPFRFVANEWVPGATIVYSKFDKYVPRGDGAVSGTAGPKIVHFDRVEWAVISDSGVIAGALQSGEVDWWDYALVDVLPQLKRDPGVRVEVLEPTGQIPIIRVNQLTPPFDKQGVRQALLAAIDQSEFMRGLGGDASLWHAPVGVFCPNTPMASDVGLAPLSGPRDWPAVKAKLQAAGYGGEKVVFLAATDSPQIQTLCEIGADAMRQAGFTVDYQAMDWGTVIQRRAKKTPIDQGGWSAFVTNGWQGTDMLDPVGNISLRGNGADAWVGWPTAPKLEALRRDWMAEPSVDGQKRIAVEMQAQAWIDVPYVPLGQNLQPSAFRADLDGVLKGFPVFWNVRRVS